MKGQSRLESSTGGGIRTIPFYSPSAGSYRSKMSPLGLPGDSLAPPGAGLLGAGFGFRHAELLPFNFSMQASCPQRGQVERLPFSLAAPPLMVSPALVRSALP